jgi:hypothetical protein
LPWALRTQIHETAIIDSTGVFWMDFLRRRREFLALLGGAAVWPLRRVRSSRRYRFPDSLVHRTPQATHLSRIRTVRGLR